MRRFDDVYKVRRNNVEIRDDGRVKVLGGESKTDSKREGFGFVPIKKEIRRVKVTWLVC